MKHFEKDQYSWDKIPNSEIERLQKTLGNHLREMGIKQTKEKRISFVSKILEKQNYTCAFAGGDDRYCWNYPRNKNLTHIKLEWGHKIPLHYSHTSNEESNLILLCARCNNQIQTSRTIKQLILEFDHKLKVLRKFTDS